MKSGQLARSQFCALHAVCWRAVLLEDEPGAGGQQAVADFHEIWKQLANVIRAMNFSFLFVTVTSSAVTWGPIHRRS